VYFGRDLPTDSASHVFTGVSLGKACVSGLQGKVPFPSSKIAALKWKEKCKASSCLPVIHQDWCFKVQRKVLLCFAGFADYGQKMILPSCMILLNFRNSKFHHSILSAI
jgi:hypothetical protein